jgi:hypothetical protein
MEFTGLQFSVWAALLTALIVIIEAIISFSEKTFSRKQGRVNLSFCWHWGVSIGDLVILPVVNGLVVPHLSFGIWFFIFLGLSFNITWFCHKAWWPDPQNSLAQGFIFANAKSGHIHRNLWYRDMTWAGWIHFLFMTIQIVILGGYLITPMPKDIVSLISWIFIVFIPVAVIEPGIIQTGGLQKLTRKDQILTLGMTLALYGLLVIAYLIKKS